MSAVALHDDGWAIRALPPGRRDLGCRELWERSLARSRRRRAQAERRTGLPVRAVSAALLTTLIVVPAADLANAQDATAGPLLPSRRSVLAMPAGFTSSGLPVGFQLAANHYRDVQLLSYAKAFEERTGTARIRPALGTVGVTG